jgi:hypothetical protein
MVLKSSLLPANIHSKISFENMQTLYTEKPFFSFSTTKKCISVTGNIYAQLVACSFKDIGDFFNYAQRNYDYIVLLEGLKSFQEIGSTIYARYWGYKMATKTKPAVMSNSIGA